MAEPQRFEPNPGADDQVIRPVGYRPPQQAREARFALSGLQVALLLAVVAVAGLLWFMFTAKSVRLDFDPAGAEASLSGGLALRLGDVWLAREGEYVVDASAPGYAPFTGMLNVTDRRNQTHTFALTKLPGRVTFVSEPPEATVTVAGETLGTTPTAPLDVVAGPATFTFVKDRYQPLEIEAEVEGMERAQTVGATLTPNWADVTVTSTPEGAEIFIDDEPTGLSTPAVVEVLAGEHEIRLKAPGHRSHRQRILVAAEETRELPRVTLTQADSLLTVRTTPPGAGVTLNGRFQGESPLELAVRSGVNHRVQVFRSGYQSAEQSVQLAPGAERALNLNLERLTGTLVIQAQPQQAELFINGRAMGPANQTLKLPTERQKVEIRLAGYAGYSTEITPRDGIAQELKVRLLTVEEARLAALKPVVTTPAGQELVLLQPSSFTMGASRREPGRRANETLRDVALTRMFYLGRHEVTNEQFRRFASDHDSGTFQDYKLSDPKQPVVNVSWQQAAAYCNWLSEQEGLPPFYSLRGDEVVGYDANSTGYRLPTEAEWAWASRQVQAPADELRFPWGGNLPPPDRHGNYADRSIAHLVGRVIFGYNDNHIVAAPVGTFPANKAGIFDLSGNVAEWTHDFYEIPDGNPATDPLGPDSGEYRVIRGSSWMHGTLTELRLTFRDYGSSGRQDVGFRVARFAEPPGQ
jgi:formylglycine-generating enzyme required for sulfatase activity